MRQLVKGLIMATVLASSGSVFASDMIRHDKEFFPNYYGPYATPEFVKAERDKHPTYRQKVRTVQHHHSVNVPKKASHKPIKAHTSYSSHLNRD